MKPGNTLNIPDANDNSSQKKVLHVLNEKGTAAPYMNTLAGQNARISRKLNVPVILCRKYALSLSVSPVSCNIQSSDALDSDLDVVPNLKP